MSGMLLFIKFFEGPYVLKKAQMIDIVRIKKNSLTGNVKGEGIPMNILLWTVILQPTNVPITTPEKLLDKTSMKAS